MGRFLLRRFISSIPVIIGILALVFALARMIPGDPCRAALGERATDEICDAYNERYGLNEPIVVQFGIYLGDVLTGDLGESFRFGVPVTDLLIQRLPTTIELAAAASSSLSLSAYHSESSPRIATTRRPMSPP